ncbi:MAG TPA: FAD-dependent monooxygenase, partial [Herpetosiphonaceae bacterium]
MCAKKAVIVGCGVGGPVAALLLRRAGFEPEICEAQAGPDDYSGLFLNLASNGLRVLDELGLAAAVSAEGFACPRMVMWSGSGKRLGEVRNGAAPGQGAASVIIKRAALHRVLREAAERAGVPIRWGKQLTGYDALPDGRLRVAFADGGETIADLLVGADGLHSRARRLIDPAAPDPAYTGLVSCGGFAYCPGLEPTPGVQHFIFGRKAFFGYLVKPGGETYWFNNLAYPGAPRRAELEAIPDAEWRRRLLELHAGDQPFINEIITATEGPIGRYPIYDLPALRR